MAKKTIIFSLLFFIGIIACPQRIDSLKNILKTSISDTTRCNILAELAETASDEEWPVFNEQLKNRCELFLKTCSEKDPAKLFYLRYLAATINNIGILAQMRSDFPVALENFSKSLSIQEQIGDEKGVAVSFVNIGNVHRSKGEVSKAIEHYEKSLEIRERIGDLDGVGNCLNNLAKILEDQGDLPKALEYAYKSLQIRERTGNKTGVATSLINIGYIFYQKNDHPRALEYYNKCIKILEDINDKQGIATCMTNIGSLYQDEGDYQLAADYFGKGLQLFREVGDKNGQACTLNNFGNTFKRQNKLEQALDYYNQSFTLFEQISDKKGLAISLDNISGVLLLSGKWEKAKPLSERSLKLAMELGYPELIKNTSNSLSKIYVLAGNFKGAYEMQVLFKSMSDSLTREADQKALLQKAFEYEYEKKAAADSIKTVEERKVHAAQIKEERTQRFALYGGLTLVLAFAGFMFNRFRLTQKQKRIIEEQKLKVDHAYGQLNEKNKEVLDSIHYAKRIQQALITNEKYVDSQLTRLKKV